VDELYRQFDQLGLSRKEYKAVFENKVHLVKRLFGKSNGDADRLVIPPSSELDGRSVRIEDFSNTERGIKLGGTTLIASPGVFLGGRYSFLHGSRYVPDLMLELEGVLTTAGKGYFSTAALASYPIDAITKIIGGAGLVTDSLEFKNRQWDWIVGLEFRVGGFRVSTTARHLGEITDSGLDLRLYYFF
jgi:hypothetical protein